MKKEIIDNISVALNYVENAYSTLKYHVENENSLNEKQRENLYKYGLDLAKLNLVKLSNVKKSLLSVTANMKCIKE
jgi:hypothetical protein